MDITVRVNEDLTLIQKSDGLVFGTDAFLLSAMAFGGQRAVCADLGSGTGIISLLCASKKKFKRIYAVEIQNDFADLIKKNTDVNGLDGIIVPLCQDIRTLDSRDLDGEIDVVLANPPYMKLNSGKRNQSDSKFIARHEVCGDIGDFCACARRILKHGGKFFTVWRPDRLTDLICALRENKLEPKQIIFVYATPESQPSMVLIQSTKGAASSSVVTRPLFLHSSREDAKSNILSPDAQAIYDSCSFDAFNKNSTL